MVFHFFQFYVFIFPFSISACGWTGVWCVCALTACTALKDFDEVLTKRARHVVTEIQRTVEAAEALKRRDFKKVSIFVSVCVCVGYKTSIFILYPHIFQQVKLNCYCVQRRCACVCAAWWRLVPYYSLVNRA